MISRITLVSLPRSSGAARPWMAAACHGIEKSAIIALTSLPRFADDPIDVVDVLSTAIFPSALAGIGPRSRVNISVLPATDSQRSASASYGKVSHAGQVLINLDSMLPLYRACWFSSLACSWLSHHPPPMRSPRARMTRRSHDRGPPFSPSAGPD